MSLPITSILLVDDDEEEARFPIRSFFERHRDVRLLEAADAAGLREHAGSVDALVVDVRLSQGVPDLGITTVVALIKDGTIAPTVPIVFISSWEQGNPMIQPSLDSPVLVNRYKFLRKPFMSTHLLQVLESERVRLAEFRGQA